MLKRCLAAIALGAIACGGLSIEAARAAELAEIQARGKLIVAVKDNTAPLGFRDESGRLQGFEIEVVRGLAAELLGNADAVEFVPVRNQERLQALLEGRVDLVVAQLSATPTRARVVAFSSPYYFESAAFVSAEAGIDTWRDLAGRRVAVLAGSQAAVALAGDLLPEPATSVLVTSYQEALELLERGEAAAFVGDASVLIGWVQEFPRYRLGDFPKVDFVPRSLSVGIPRGKQYNPLRERINVAIARWRQSGWLDEARRRWGLP